MRLNELLEPGDVIHSTFHPTHYVISDGKSWNRLTGRIGSLNEGFNYSSLPRWVTSIVRGSEDITEQIEAELNKPSFKFGDKVQHVSTPTVGLFLEERGDNALVAFEADKGSVSIEEHPLSVLKPLGA